MIAPTWFDESTTPLGASASFTGEARRASRMGSSAPGPMYGSFRAWAFADQAGTLHVEASRDGTTFRQIGAGTSVTANQAVQREELAVAPYYRVRFVNGATAQGAFALGSALVGPEK